MTVKQYWKLKQYEDTLFTALKCDYFRNLTQKSRNDLDEVYEDLFKKKGQINAACGACQLRSLKELARPFFQMKEKMDKGKSTVNVSADNSDLNMEKKQEKVEEPQITEQTPEIENGTGEETNE